MRNVKLWLLGMVLVLVAGLSYAEVVEEFESEIVDVYSNEQRNFPQFCFKWTGIFSESNIHYEDYVLLKDVTDDAVVEIKPVVTTKDRTLCVNHLKHGRNYIVEFRAGLPLTGSLPTTSNKVQHISMPNRKPSIAFPMNRSILPTLSSQQVTLNLINTPKFTVKAYRLNPAMINNYIRKNSLHKAHYEYNDNQLIENSEFLGSEQYEIDLEPNRKQEVGLDLSSLINRKEAGGYLLVVKPEYENNPVRMFTDLPTQFLLLTDIAITSYRHQQGMDLYIRSYQSGKLLSGVEVTLIAKNLNKLSSAISDKNGHINFDQALLNGKGGMKPIAITAQGMSEGDEHYAFMDLSKHKLDLSDRDIAGREAVPLMDSYIYLDKGVYRPNESVHISAILRDAKLNAPIGIPLTLQLMRPDGIVIEEVIVTPNSAGVFSYEYKIPSSVRRGSWSIKLLADPEAAPLAIEALLIEDYVPPTIKSTISLDNEEITTKENLTIAVQGDYLYGAPAANRVVEGEATLQADRTLNHKWKGYLFGREDHGFASRRIPLSQTITNSKGGAILRVPNYRFPKHTPSVPISLGISSGVVEPSGRVQRSHLKKIMKTYPVWIGVRELDDKGVSLNKSIQLSIKSVDGNGDILQKSLLQFSLIREEWDYHWYRESDKWKSETLKYDVEKVLVGEVVTDQNGDGVIEVNPLSWGHYRVEVMDTVSGSTTSMRFKAGWWGDSPEQSARPDNIQMAVSSAQAEVGDVIKVYVTPPFEGEAHLMVARDHILESQFMSIPKDGGEFELTVEESWGSGVYLMLQMVRSGEVDSGPARAVGISYLEINMKDKVGEVVITTAPRIESDQIIEVEVKSRGMSDNAVVTVAVVDEGVLSLTNFSSPDPKSHFLAKRKLGVDIYDQYGHLIQHSSGEILKANFGGDGVVKRSGTPEIFFKPIALFSGIVKLDSAGQAKVSFKLPEKSGYNGKLRVMVIAVDERSFASSSSSIVVRDPVVLLPALPRFIAVGDTAEISLNVTNMDAEEGVYSLEWESDDGRKVGNHTQTVLLQRNQEQSVTNYLKGVHDSAGNVRVTLTSPTGISWEYEWAVPVYEMRSIFKDSNFDKIELGEQIFKMSPRNVVYIPETISTTYTLARYPKLDMRWLVSDLNRYPFGCLEQTTSKAFPLLYLSSFSELKDKKLLTSGMRKRIEKGVRRIETMQLASGAFSLWPNQRREERWLTAYATHFLLEAKSQKYRVSEFVINRAMRWIKRELLNSKHLSHRSYALYLLARVGGVDIGTLRYTLDQIQRKGADKIVIAQIGAAFALLGDSERSRSAFEMVTKYQSLDKYSSSSWRRINYGSTVRDLAVLSYFEQESKLPSYRGVKSAHMAIKSALDSEYLSTQEKAWLVLMSYRMQQQSEEDELYATILVDGKRTTKTKFIDMLDKLGSDSVNITNLAGYPLYLIRNSSGMLDEPVKSSGRGMRVKKEIRDLDTGDIVSSQEVKKGDSYQVILQVEIDKGSDLELSIIDPIPAGFEIENSRLGGLSLLNSELEITQTNFEELRDDRYLAAYTLNSGRNSVGLKDGVVVAAYIMRAVTAGKFIAAATEVKDMYRPLISANGAESTLVVR
ncbi:MAG: alpha-2-macroglobulin family protein [Thiotrichales bacterium]|nr:alpha-2-macroglobulin family protein [Thiotrichales bacterium]